MTATLGIGGAFRSRLDCYESMATVYVILAAPGGEIVRYDSGSSNVVKITPPTPGFAETYIFISPALKKPGTWRQFWVTDLGMSSEVSRNVTGSNNPAIDAFITGQS